MIDAHFAPVTLWPPLHMEFDGAVSIVALSQVGQVFEIVILGRIVAAVDICFDDFSLNVVSCH